AVATSAHMYSKNSSSLNIVNPVLVCACRCRSLVILATTSSPFTCRRENTPEQCGARGYRGRRGLVVLVLILVLVVNVFDGKLLSHQRIVVGVDVDDYVHGLGVVLGFHGHGRCRETT